MAVAPTPSASSAETLTKLCKSRQWQAIIEHVRAHPSDAKAVAASRGSLTPLHIVCENGAPIQVIKALLTANPSAAQAKSGLHDRLPLHCLLAAATTYPLQDVVVSTLVEAYPGACRVTDKNGSLPIHLACQAVPVSDEIFTSILSMYPEGAYARNFGGMYPLHIAASNKDVKTKKIALAALDRGTLYASISKMTAIRLSKEHETQTKTLEKAQADKLNKMESHAKEERTKLKKEIESLKSQLKAEKETNQKHQEEKKTLSIQHQENIAHAIQKEQTKASDMERELRSDLAEVQLKNMDLLEQVENVQSDLDTSNTKVETQSETIKELEKNLEGTIKTLSDTKNTLESTNKELSSTQDDLASAQSVIEDKAKYILHLETSLKEAKETVLSLVKEQEKMNFAMKVQKETLAALLLGHESSMKEGNTLKSKMVDLAADIGKATEKDAIDTDEAIVEGSKEDVEKVAEKDEIDTDKAIVEEAKEEQ